MPYRQALYIDHITVSCEGEQPRAPTSAPHPDSPTEGGPPTASSVVFVMAIEGAAILPDQDDGTELAVSCVCCMCCM